MLWLLLIAGIAADQLTTAYGLRRYGLKLEGNPLIRAVWRRWGPPGTLAVQCAVLFPVLWLMETYEPSLAFLVPLLPLVAAANNVRVVIVMSRRRRRKADARLRPDRRSGSDAEAMGG